MAVGIARKVANLSAYGLGPQKPPPLGMAAGHVHLSDGRPFDEGSRLQIICGCENENWGPTLNSFYSWLSLYPATAIGEGGRQTGRPLQRENSPSWPSSDNYNISNRLKWPLHSQQPRRQQPAIG
jgi:hypothetical protein